MTDPVAFLEEAHKQAEQSAEAAAARAWSPHWVYDDLVHEIRDLNNGNTLANIYWPEIGNYVAANQPAATLRRIAADRKILAEIARGVEYEAEGLADTIISNLAEGWGWTEEEGLRHG